MVEGGREKRIQEKDRYIEVWDRLQKRALDQAEKKPIEWWREQAWKEREITGKCGPIAEQVRDAALRSPRAFVQFTNQQDDEGNVIELADFHLDVISAMRQHTPACIILPLEHGKTYLSSIVVPLMDWAEWPNATECRIYWNESHVKKQILRLMQQVEYNEELQKIFPWIRRPTSEDKSKQWGTEGFSIGGRTLADRSFEPLTARGFSVGNRYSVVAADDWVTRGNCSSVVEQDKLDDHFHQAVMSMAQRVKRESKYGTKWGRCYLTGTLYDRRDVNYRVSAEFTKKGFKSLVYRVYPKGRGHRDIVLWPEGRPPEYIEEMEQRLGPRNFRLRMMNQVIEEGMQCFPDEQVEAATQENYEYGVLPLGSVAVIGFDPASGKTTSASADPAIVLYAEVDDPDPEPKWGELADLREKRASGPRAFTSHFVKWQRLQGYDFPKQCGEIINWARYYQLPVVIESNTLQKSYKDYISQVAPDVKVFLRHTGSNVMDPEDGIETFSDLFNAGRMIIHAGKAPWEEMRALTTQLVEWPQSRKKDLLMAFWFGKYFMAGRQRRRTSTNIQHNIPQYVEDSLWYWEQQAI